MIVISGTIYIKKDKISEAIELAKEMMEKTGEEVGCISYRFYSDIESPDIFRIFALWKLACFRAQRGDFTHRSTEVL